MLDLTVSVLFCITDQLTVFQVSSINWVILFALTFVTYRQDEVEGASSQTLGCNRNFRLGPKDPGRFHDRFSVLDGLLLFQLISTYRSSESIDVSQASNITSSGSTTTNRGVCSVSGVGLEVFPFGVGPIMVVDQN